MKLNGKNVTIKEMTNILTNKSDYKNGIITKSELIGLYRIQVLKKLSKVGKNNETFNNFYDMLTDDIKENCTFEQIATIIDLLYDSYSNGKNEKREG